MQTIPNPSALRRAIVRGKTEFKLCLRGGLYSGKTITLLPDNRFLVANHIDDTLQRLTVRQLSTHSNIGQAMRMGALVADA